MLLYTYVNPIKEKISRLTMWCWWCCHPFEWTPLSMPHKYDDRTKVFQTSGNFCSWSCMKSYTIDTYGINRGGLVCGNIVLMRKQMFNQIGSIKKAPWRYRLKVFGGDLSIEEFRNNLTKDMSEPLHEPIKTKPKVENVIPFISNTKKMNEIKNATSDNSSLKLKRNKPLKRNHNNLESALGLIITPKS